MHEFGDKHFLSLTAADWQAWAQSLRLPKFRSAQIVEWIYDKRTWSPEEMSNLPTSLRRQLAEGFDWSLPEIIDTLDSQDQSTKLLLRSKRQQTMEAVIMRYANRVSLCVSSQVGCKLACSFCQTGKLGFFRHLTFEEIIGQFALADAIVRKEGRKISHVVFMGMGEPLDNYDNAVQAANRMIGCDGTGFGLNPKNVTISTSGMVPRIIQLTDDSPAALAISLHAARDDLRTELMPINRKYPLETLKDALLTYQAKTGKKITIEYILIKDKNCGRREAKDLVRFLHGLRAKINLIPFNDHPGLPYKRPTDEEIRDFQSYLTARSFAAPVRYSKGLDVSAACGQLAAKHKDQLAQSPARQNVLRQL